MLVIYPVKLEPEDFVASLPMVKLFVVSLKLYEFETFEPICVPLRNAFTIPVFLVTAK
jgi:hypothetical protein